MKPNLKISNNTVIYVAAPAKVATGGPELLHQIAYHLITDLGYETYMYYIPSDVEDPIPSPYKNYGNPYVKKIKDNPENILIVPEVMLGIKLLKKFQAIQKVIWWLSIDNFLISFLLANRLRFLFPRLLNKASRHFLGKSLINVNDLIYEKYFKDKRKLIATFNRLFGQFCSANIALHLCQSYYALDFLKTFSIDNVAYLSDYLNQAFLSQTFDIKTKEDIVIYNPKKGFLFTKKIIRSAPDLNFRPIENMSREEVIDLLKKAKVYIDFGNHPGKDRMPREAAILGCCVIVGKVGSAGNSKDVPIPEEFKFDRDERNIPVIIEKIRECVRDYNMVIHHFDAYRAVIRNEPSQFLENLKLIFGKKKLRR